MVVGLHGFVAFVLLSQWAVHFSGFSYLKLHSADHQPYASRNVRTACKTTASSQALDFVIVA
jgi:hypothetical protein